MKTSIQYDLLDNFKNDYDRNFTVLQKQFSLYMFALSVF